MARIIIFNETTGDILEDIPSGNTPAYEGRSDVLINPDDSALAAVPKKYWKVDIILLILKEMSQAEKDVLDLKEAQDVAIAQAEEDVNKGRRILQRFNAKFLEVSGKTISQKANFIKSISDVVLLLQAGQLKAAKAVLLSLTEDVDRDGALLAKIKEFIQGEV